MKEIALRSAEADSVKVSGWPTATSILHGRTYVQSTCLSCAALARCSPGVSCTCSAHAPANRGHFAPQVVVQREEAVAAGEAAKVKAIKDECEADLAEVNWGWMGSAGVCMMAAPRVHHAVVCCSLPHSAYSPCTSHSKRTLVHRLTAWRIDCGTAFTMAPPGHACAGGGAARARHADQE